MIIEGRPDEADLGPDDYDFDPPDLPEIDEEFEPWENQSIEIGLFQCCDGLRYRI